MTRKQKSALAKARRKWQSMSHAARKRARARACAKPRIVHKKGHSRHLLRASSHIVRAHSYLRAALKGSRHKKYAKRLL